MRTVLFVCEGNTFRSVIAEAIFNADAPTGWIAASAGIRAGVATSPAAIALLQTAGIHRPSLSPRTVTAAQIEDAEIVVTLGCRLQLPGSPKGITEDRPVPGGMGRTPEQREAIRDEIRDRVVGLIRTVTSESP